jgi:hypothetical protein
MKPEKISKAITAKLPKAVWQNIIAAATEKIKSTPSGVLFFCQKTGKQW